MPLAGATSTTLQVYKYTSNYIPALSMEKIMYGYPEREKKWIKDYNFKFPQWIFGLSSWY